MCSTWPATKLPRCVRIAVTQAGVISLNGFDGMLLLCRIAFLSAMP